MILKSTLEPLEPTRSHSKQIYHIQMNYGQKAMTFMSLCHTKTGTKAKINKETKLETKLNQHKNQNRIKTKNLTRPKLKTNNNQN